MKASLSVVAFFLVMSITGQSLVNAACNVNNTGTNFTRGSSVYGSGASFILGRAASYAALASSTVTNVGNSVLTGDIGTSPGVSITGFGPGVFTGAKHAADSASYLAQTDLITAYNVLAGLPCNTELTGTNLGGLVLTPGVYKFASSAALSSVALTLKGTQNPKDAWVFQIASTLTTDPSASIILTNGSRSSNVFWQVGSSATLGHDTQFVGSLLAYSSITVNTGVSIDGRALALNAAVTLIDNAITVPSGDSSNCTALTPVLQNSSSPINASETSISITCVSSSCPTTLSQFAGLPFAFAGDGAGSAKCVSMSALTADGFTCQISGNFSSSGGNLYLLVGTVNTTEDNTCFGESLMTRVGVIPGAAEASSGGRLSSAAWNLAASLAAYRM